MSSDLRPTIAGRVELSLVLDPTRASALSDFLPANNPIPIPNSAADRFFFFFSSSSRPLIIKSILSELSFLTIIWLLVESTEVTDDDELAKVCFDDANRPINRFPKFDFVNSGEADLDRVGLAED